ncbi:GIY-YIG nuclease family protein [Burkholderia pseudomallei]|uniref:GIY-YIG nuclease family protein n=1 Tax=Burkholderia pseudomallei TaxID=28450 RepID=UPI0021F7A26E|nr:GIY-YIG nuclease family protein [Burkholderia pseudomallei]MCW0159669.1 GIY-YIG nuclease family protein [Burkholderia pseudomallei]
MPIDNCKYTFDELSFSILPGHLERLKEALRKPIPAASFVGYKSATREALSEAGRTTDFPGCYVFVDIDRPVYVGISRNVVKRLVQHLNFESHYSASLVYRMASEDFPHEMKRDQAMKDDQFRRVFLTAQGRLREMSVAYVEIDNDLELYLFEVLAAMRLDTDTWNTFRTH